MHDARSCSFLHGKGNSYVSWVHIWAQLLDNRAIRKAHRRHQPAHLQKGLGIRIWMRLAPVAAPPDPQGKPLDGMSSTHASLTDCFQIHSMIAILDWGINNTLQSIDLAAQTRAGQTFEGWTWQRSWPTFPVWAFGENPRRRLLGGRDYQGFRDPGILTPYKPIASGCYCPYGTPGCPDLDIDRYVNNSRVGAKPIPLPTTPTTNPAWLGNVLGLLWHCHWRRPPSDGPCLIVLPVLLGAWWQAEAAVKKCRGGPANQHRHFADSCTQYSRDAQQTPAQLPGLPVKSLSLTLQANSAGQLRLRLVGVDPP
ncbi:hypothetical protein WJX74_009634 [Apatococcus lobatus]|uniref:Uncharacterized protein n=1 Tax=Apatococcus lobatus TaxID=904363 RepID=A0AAW1SCM3_9CHLO